MDPLWLSDHLLSWLRSPLGAAAFVPLYALWVTLLLPGVWASMLAGVLYGPVAGSVLVFAGACLGAQAGFLLGRGRWRGWARRRLAGAPRLQAVEQAVCRQGLVLVLLTRLSPAFPFSLLNLAYGLSEVSLRDYSIGLIGILPGTVLFCALGAAAGDPRRFSGPAGRPGRWRHLGPAAAGGGGHPGGGAAGGPPGAPGPGGTRGSLPRCDAGQRWRGPRLPPTPAPASAPTAAASASPRCGGCG